METLSVVADAGPLIALAKANLIDLLDQIFVGIYIPDAVRNEVLAKQSRESRGIRAALSTFITTSNPANPPHQVTIVTRHLDLGEAEAITLAYERQTLLLIDDALGRKAAQKLSLPVVGTIGIVLRAKQLRLSQNNNYPCVGKASSHSRQKRSKQRILICLEWPEAC